MDDFNRDARRQNRATGRSPPSPALGLYPAPRHVVMEHVVMENDAWAQANRAWMIACRIAAMRLDQTSTQ